MRIAAFIDTHRPTTCYVREYCKKSICYYLLLLLRIITFTAKICSCAYHFRISGESTGHNDRTIPRVHAKVLLFYTIGYTFRRHFTGLLNVVYRVRYCCLRIIYNNIIGLHRLQLSAFRRLQWHLQVKVLREKISKPNTSRHCFGLWD